MATYILKRKYFALLEAAADAVGSNMTKSASSFKGGFAPGLTVGMTAISAVGHKKQYESTEEQMGQSLKAAKNTTKQSEELAGR